MTRSTSRAGVILAAVAAGWTLWATPTRADTPDAWITTKAKMALLTTDGVSGTAIDVDTEAGEVTLHGKVESDAEKAKAESTVKAIDGVKGVKNLLQVVPEQRADAVEASDAELETRVEQALDADAAAADVEVRSVNKGVVLLGGEVKTLTDHLRAIEIAAKVPGVRRVESEIKSPDKVASGTR
jgi:hyperosmotically inducible protein